MYEQKNSDKNDATKLEEKLEKFSDKSKNWTDSKSTERVKLTARLLDNGVILGLMRKSDYEGFKRLIENLSILVLTAYFIYQLDIFSINIVGNIDKLKLAIFIPLYLFYGFQFQCFAFAGNHEFLHGNAFKSKCYNDWVMFAVGVTCFEFGKHERLMHKQHHIYTNNIDKDPELTSFFSRDELENASFRGVVYSRFGYLKGFYDIFFPFQCRAMRIISAACGVPIDYSGKGWSMKTQVYGPESVQDLKVTARLHLFIYVSIFLLFGRTKEGMKALLFWWIVPVIIGYAPINYFRNAEHADCELSKTPNMLRNTRTVESNALIRQLLWNTNYHAEHHAFPMVPFFNLPKVHELIDGHIVHNEHKSFTSQNWAYVSNGGWIDQQNFEAPIKQK